MNNIEYKIPIVDPLYMTVKILPGNIPGIEQKLFNTIKGIPPRGTRGKYKVAFTFMRTEVETSKQSPINMDLYLIGDSNIILSSNQSFTVEIDDKVTIFNAFVNKDGRLGLIECEIDADNIAQAEQSAYNLLTPMLSSWSCNLDIPIKISRKYVLEKATNNFCMDLVTNYSDIKFEKVPRFYAQHNIDVEFRNYSSIYHEALNSGSSIFAFLCYFKIIEGIIIRRSRLIREAKNIGKEFPRYIEEFPKSNEDLRIWLDALFYYRSNWQEIDLIACCPQEVRGKRFSKIFKKLKPIRNIVAHALTKTGKINSNPDDLLYRRLVDYWLPVVKIMVRRMLKNEFPNEFLLFIDETGNLKQK